MNDGDNTMENNKWLEGLRVIHDNSIKSLGIGTIVEVDPKYIWIAFDKEKDGKPRRFLMTSLDGDLLRVAETQSEEKLSLLERVIKEADRQARYDALLSKLKTYGFEGFVHYTAYDNLKSILDSGYIYSRGEMISRGTEWVDVAEVSVLQDTPDEVKNKVRLLYGFNTPISYWFERRAKERNTEMVAIVIAPRIFLERKVQCYERSAARSMYGNSSSDMELVKNYNWNEIFERGSLSMDDCVKDYKKKYRDAEVVVDGSLSTEYISAIYFRSEEFLKKAKQEIGCYDFFRRGRISSDKHFTPGV